ncbi:hypothetical protein [Aquisphaera insulae]|uniref:hypothetical protein n=1 Tax=Aquisphaera insulae TaxID=2712864 RepID=UPI0013EC43C2|nr:hypothetical protein [Aquisphaera insulae]
MRDLTVLAVSDDARWLARFWAEVRCFPGARLVIARSLAEGAELIDCTAPDLIAVDWPRSTDGRRADEMDQLLWSNSILPRPATVLVADEHYDDQTALDLFRGGVDEYISMTEHPNRIASVVGQWLGRSPEVSPWREEVGPRTTAGLVPVPATEPVAAMTSA